MTQSGSSQRIVNVSAPSSGASLAVPAAEGSAYSFAFDPAGATVSRSEDSLVFSFDNGGKVAIVDFLKQARTLFLT